MHTLAFLEPGHFHATLTLREPHPDVSPEIAVYAAQGPELDDFLALVERFNRRAERPTRWRPRVRSSGDPLAQLLDERAGDVVVLAGRNGGKAATIRRLHEAGLHVLADKPWLVRPEDLDAIRASLSGWPLAREMMAGRRAAAARLVKRLVDAPELLGGLVDGGAEPAIEHESVHHFEKLVDGAPLRRPPWYFDTRVQGSGAVDITTHIVDQAQWLLDGRSGDAAPRLLTARGWSTRVPLAAFARISGAAGVPPELAPAVEGPALRVFCNAELTYAIAGATARAATRWDLAAPPGGGDTSRTIVRGRTAVLRVEQTAETGYRRRILVEAQDDGGRIARALADALAAASDELPGVRSRPLAPGLHEVDVPAALDAGHEAHFAELLGELLGWITAGRGPSGLAERTLAKYALLADAAAATTDDDAAAR